MSCSIHSIQRGDCLPCVQEAVFKLRGLLDEASKERTELRGLLRHAGIALRGNSDVARFAVANLIEVSLQPRPPAESTEVFLRNISNT